MFVLSTQTLQQEHFWKNATGSPRGSRGQLTLEGDTDAENEYKEILKKKMSKTTNSHFYMKVHRES